MKLRLLPIAVVVATVLLGVKLTELWRGVGAFVATPAHAAAAQAQSLPQSQPGPAPAPAADASSQDSPANGSLPAAGSGSGDDPMLMSQSEIDLLQQLSQRRGELEIWSHDLSTREQLLKAAELRIESKITDLKTIQNSIKSSLKQHDVEQEAKLKSLVKIYETMKPKDAARIFEQLEMPILLDVIERMKETKAAPVIASMDPGKAKMLTTEMAKLRRLVGEESQRVAEQASSNN